MLPQAILLFMALASPLDGASVPPRYDGELESPPDFGSRLERVHMEEHGDSTEIVALDSMGSPIGVLSVWADSAGVVHVDSDYDDGYLHVAVVDGIPVIDSTLDPDIAAERAALIGNELVVPNPPDVPVGWGACAFAATGTVIAAATANPWVIGGAIASACSCLPMIIEEFEDMKCPLW
ncbi:hypothetical protein [Enhygromyxa salina]|uniref:Uncharacterized protein n=1 Tax=Enhygromyxa salina TaxID=215803 RepID=A0A2S9XU81_9BACT|nr:hypothetical protein [Enhygromyxa salina]PRP96439.1 hypothetical protein ENSA7_72540 [Enhygromyxa salina]